MSRYNLAQHAIHADEVGPTLVCERPGCTWWVPADGKNLEQLVSEAGAHIRRMHIRR